MAYVGTSIDNARTHPRAVGELAGLFPDLRSQLTGWGQDEGRRVGLAAATHTRGWRRSWSALEEFREDGEEESTSLARASLGTGHQVAVGADNGDRVLLDWGRLSVLGEFNVLQEQWVQWRAGEGQYRVGDIVARGFDGDVVVLFKIDAGALAVLVFGSVELALKTRVAGCRNLHAVLEGANVSVQARVSRGGGRRVIAASVVAARGGTLVPVGSVGRAGGV